MEINNIYSALIEGGYFTESELQLLTNINGWSTETLNDAIYARYGFRDFEQLTEGE